MMANKINYADLNGWLKTLVVIGWVYTFCIAVYLLGF